MSGRLYRFDKFELNTDEGELRCNGDRIRLQEKPLLLLSVLLENPQQMVSREELRKRLWQGGTFVDFEKGINVAIKKVRDSLGDSVEQPRYIQTITKKGYKFLLPVEAVDRGLARGIPGSPPALPPASDAGVLQNRWQERPHWGTMRWALVTLGALITVAAAMLVGSSSSRSQVLETRATLIVLPLDNLSGDPNQEYFSDGITEELSTQLARLDPERLAVIGRLTAMRYKHSGKDIAQIGKETHANYVLEGSVRRDETGVRVTVQLIEVATQTHLWAEEYDRTLNSVLGIQREIATTIANQIHLKLTAERRNELASGASATVEAHDDYLKGRYEWNKRTEDGFRAAVRYFEEALRREPDYAPAYAGLADSYNLLAQWGYILPDEGYPKAKLYAQKALQLDGTLAEAYTALADVEIKYDRNWQKGEADFRQAIKLNPNYATAHLWYAEDCLTPSKRNVEAIREVRKAQEIEPLSPIIGAIAAETSYFAREYDKAIQQSNDVLEMEPGFLPAIERLGWAYEQKKMFPEAIAEFQKAVELSAGSIEMKTQLAHAYALSGNTREAKRILSEVLAESRVHYTSPYFFAVIYTALGDKDSALQWLRRTYDAHDVPPLQVEPRFDSLRADRRFQDLLRAIDAN